MRDPYAEKQEQKKPETTRAKMKRPEMLLSSDVGPSTPLMEVGGRLPLDLRAQGLHRLHLDVRLHRRRWKAQEHGLPDRFKSQQSDLELQM